MTRSNQGRKDEITSTDEDRSSLIGDRGEDDAFATESHPEGFRGHAKPHRPGELPHPQRPPQRKIHHPPPVSIEDDDEGSE